MLTVNAYAATSPTEPLVPTTITRRDVGPRDVLIEIAYAGVCHSDIHTVRVDWGPITYPEVVGHEVAGTVVEVGTDVTKHAAIASVSVRSSTPAASATTVGPGRSSTAFRATRRPTAASTGTAPSQGGYSTHVVVDEDFVLRIPASLDSSKVAPLLGAGITTYSPPPACTRPAKPAPITKSLGRSTHA